MVHVHTGTHAHTHTNTCMQHVRDAGLREEKKDGHDHNDEDRAVRDLTLLLLCDPSWVDTNKRLPREAPQ